MQTVPPAQAEGSSIWNPGYETSVGVQHENICSYAEDDGVFSVLQALGSTKHMIAGHDHVNNWIIDYKGIKLIYGLKSGCGCYWDPVLNGGTVLTIGQNGVKEVRQEYVDASGI